MQRTSVSGTDGRRRPPRACTNCAKRKVSCDKMRPSCSRCARNDIRCHYAFGNPSSAGSVAIIDETPAIIAEQSLISSRLERLGDMITELGPTETPHSSSADPTTRPATKSTKEYPGHLFNGNQTKGRYLSPTSFALINQEISSINALIRAQQRYSVNRPGNTSPISSRKASKAASASDGSEAIGTKHLYGDIFPRLPFWPTVESVQEPFGTGSSAEQIVAELPSPDLCDILIRAYMLGYHTMKPIIDVPAFIQEFGQMQRWSTGLNKDYILGTHFLSLLVAVLFAGCVVCPRARLQPSLGDNAREMLSSRLYKLAISSLRLCDFPQTPSLQSFAAFLIVDTTWLREEQPLTCCSFVGVAYRTAQMLGLHKDPSKFGGIDPREIELRRHLWWTLVAIDAQVALASGLPPLIACDFYDVKPITVDPKQDDDPTAAITHSPSKSPFLVFVSGKYSFYKCASEFLRVLHNNRLSESDLETMLQLAHRIRTDMENYKAQIMSNHQSAGLQLGNSMPVEGISEESDQSPFLIGLANMVLSMFAAKPYAIMYGPLRRHKLLDALWSKEPDAMMNCREYLYRFLHLTQCSNYQPWHWCWPGQHQPLHSIMALIADLNDFPLGPFVKETRQLVDLALSLCNNGSDSSGIISVDNGAPDSRPLHDGGNEAWKFIRRARDECWEKAGLDPETLYCPENVGEIKFEGYSFTDEHSGQLDQYDESDWSLMPFTSEDWAFLNAQVNVPNWDPNMRINSFDSYNSMG